MKLIAWTAVGIATMMTMNANAIPTIPSSFNLVVETDPQAMLVDLRIIVRSGSLSDPENLPGLAHFTARALLRGTKTRPFSDLSQAIERLGARVSISVDQTTTVISASVLNKNLGHFLDVMRDVFTQPAFDVREMDQLQKTIQGELRANLQDSRVLAKRGLLTAAYRSARMASPEGTIGGIGRITPLDLAAFFKLRYVRENLLIAVSSPLPEAELIKRINSKLDSIPSGVLDAPVIPAAQFNGRRAVIVSKQGMSTVPFYVATIGVSDGDPARPALELGNFVFGEDYTSRLIQTLRVLNGWTYSAYSDYEMFCGSQRDATLFGLYTVPGEEFVSKALPRTVEMFDSYSMLGITGAEFQDARESLGNRFAFKTDTAEKRLGLRIRETLNGRPLDSVTAYRDRLAALELTSLNRLIQGRTPTSSLWLSAVGNPDVLKPVLAGIPGVESVEVLDIQP